MLQLVQINVLFKKTKFTFFKFKIHFFPFHFVTTTKQMLVCFPQGIVTRFWFEFECKDI